jgi:hypothetical protein
LLSYASWNANRNSVRNLLRNASGFLDGLHFSNLTLDRVRNLTCFCFADHFRGAARNLLRFGFTNHASDAVVFNASLGLTYNSSGAVVNCTSHWLANHSCFTVVDHTSFWLTYVSCCGARNLLGAWLANSSADSVRNLLANFFAPVLGASNLLRGALRNPDFFADRSIWSLAANFGAASRDESSAASARICYPPTSSSVDLRVTSTRNDAGSSFKVTATNRNRFHFGVRNANSARHRAHLGFLNFTTVVRRDRFHGRRGHRLANVVSNGSLLVFLNATTHVGSDFFLVVFFDAALDCIVDSPLLHLRYRTLNCVVNCLVGCFANRTPNCVILSSILRLANGATHRHLLFFPNGLVNRSVASDLLLFINRSLHCLHDGVAASTSGCGGSCGNRVVACATTTLAPAEAG